MRFWNHYKKNHFGKLFVVALAVGAMFSGVAAAQAVTQAYGVLGNVQKGMLVMLVPKDASRVQQLTSKQQSALQGVVVAANDSAVSLSNNSTVDQVYVATSGKYDVLVSNQNGVIKSGDYISISSLDGIGMKADSSQDVILGRALDNFDGKGSVSGTATLTNSLGEKSPVLLGQVGVSVGIAHNPLNGGKGSDSSAPTVLRKLAYNIVGKSVSSIRIYISLFVLLLTFVIAGSLLYSGVRTSLTAIGRNPLARSSVLRGLFQVTLVSIIIFVIGLFAIYLLLKL